MSSILHAISASNFETSFVQSKGTKIEVRRRKAKSPAKQPAKQSVLLLHGFLAHAHWWDGVAALLPDDWDVAALSFAGMGLSEWRYSYTREDDYADVLAVLEALNFQTKPYLVGHSFGGAIGTHVKCREPKAFKRYFCVDSPIRFNPQPMGSAWSSERSYYRDVDHAVSRFRLIPQQPAVRQDFVDYIAANSLREFPDAPTQERRWSWCFDYNRISTPEENRDFWNSLIDYYESIDPRPVFIRGGNSGLCAQIWEDAFYARLGPQAPLITVPGAHHHVLLDQPEALARILVEQADLD